MPVDPEVLNFTPPPVERVLKLTALSRKWHRPVFYGLENIDPATPCLFVGNHTLYGMMDTPVMLAEVYQRTGVYYRSLGDHYHFNIPGWGPMVREMGGVDGTRDNCTALMESRQHVMVFPGGGREVSKRKNEKCKLVWKNRTGFARMAMEHGYPILPFATLGADDAYNIKYDANDIKSSWLGKKLLKNEKFLELTRNGDLLMPIGTGALGTFIPKPVRFYYMFGPMIDTTRYAGNSADADAQWELRREVENAILRMLGDLLMKREQDVEEKPLLHRLLA